jgi:hypothetical protein
VAAAYSDRWLLAGRIWVGKTTSLLHVPLARRSWTVRAEGAKVLALDRAGWGLSGRLGRIPADCDDGLLVGLVTAVIWISVRFRVRPMKPVHVVEGRAETLEALLDRPLTRPSRASPSTPSESDRSRLLAVLAGYLCPRRRSIA